MPQTNACRRAFRWCSPSAFCDRRRRVVAIYLSIGLAVTSLVLPWVASSAGGASPTPTTSVGIPSNGATLSGSTYLDAYASNATSVKFLLFGGSYGYAAPVVCTASPTIYAWLCGWDTTTVPNGSYVLVSEAINSAGSTFSSGVGVTVDDVRSTPKCSYLRRGYGRRQRRPRRLGRRDCTDHWGHIHGHPGQHGRHRRDGHADPLGLDRPVGVGCQPK